MKITLFGVCLLALVGCVSTPDATFAQATPGCKTATAQVNGQAVATQFCIKSVAFKPYQYRVTVNDQVLFTGDDFQPVAFSKTLKEGPAAGACNELIQLHGNVNKEVPLSELAPEFVTACRITADAAGNANAFNKDAACNKAFYKSMAPLLGSVLPVEVARQCTVTVGEQTVFDERFDF